MGVGGGDCGGGRRVYGVVLVLVEMSCRVLYR